MIDFVPSGLVAVCCWLISQALDTAGLRTADMSVPVGSVAERGWIHVGGETAIDWEGEGTLAAVPVEAGTTEAGSTGPVDWP